MLAGWLASRDLPEDKQPRYLRRQREEEGKQNEGVFGRLLWGGQFATLLASLKLNSDTTSCFLHPEAPRPLTCREAARVQVRWGGGAGQEAPAAYQVAARSSPAGCTWAAPALGSLFSLNTHRCPLQ